MRALVALGAVATLLVLFPSGAVGGRDASSIVWFTGNDAPAWSPDGSRIAFTAFRGGKVGDIYVMRPDGSAQRNLTKSSGHEDHAAWSPDGTKIAFTTNGNRNNEIYVMNANGSGKRRLTNNAADDFAPSWSPDGRRIAFWTNRDGNNNNEIYVMNADGSEQTRLTNNPASDHSPSWGADGRIAFVSTRGTGTRTTIYVMNGDGSEQRQLSSDSATWSESRPVWSRDGTKIAFVSGRDFPVDNVEIYVMNADGTDARRITRSPLRDDWPTWSPDGTRIAFAHGSLFHPEVYRVNVDGNGIRLLSRRTPVLESRFLRVPDARPGERFTVTLGILTGTGAPVRGARTFCSARLGGQTLAPVSRTFGASRARCSWALPRSGRGKQIGVIIGARLGTSTVSEAFTTYVF